MAHELEMKNGKAQMIYVGETPWHGLGKKLEVAPSSTEEAIKLAGLDWQIALEEMKLSDGTVVGCSKAVVRQSDRSVLGVVGNGWEPVQNGKAFQPFEPFLKAGVATIETAGSLRGGRRVWMLAKVNRPDSVIVPQADDRVAKYLMAAVGHDGTLAFRIGYTPIRVVCQNTLSVAIERGQSTHVRLSHVSGVNKAIDEITKMIEGIDARFEESAKVFRELASRKVRDSAQLREYVDAVYESAKRKQEQEGVKTFNEFFAKPHRSELPSPFSAEGGNMLAETKSKVFDEIARLFEFGRGNTNPAVAGTAWAAYNAVTEYNTWERGRSQDARLENLWMKVEGPSSRALPAAVDTFLRN